jgi:triacylglycerol lipase
MSTNDELVEVFFVPGFLGFESLGGLDYFIDVEEIVRKTLRAPGVTVNVYPTETEPAGSLQRRAAKLADQVAEHHSMDAKSVHFVGHSTGGLDIRLLLSPGNAVEQERERRAAAGDEGAGKVLDALQKTHSATSVATPHYGSPIASLALRLDVDLLLRGASEVLELAPTSYLLAKGLQVAGAVAGLMSGLPRDESFLKWVIGRVFSQPPEKLIKYLQHVTADAGALRNLTQEGTNLANALLIDRPDVRYGSIITGTQKPGGVIKTPDPFLFFNTLLFRAAWQIVAAENPDYPYAGRNTELSNLHGDDVSAGLDVGELHIDDDTSDGVVPTASQAYGTILGVFASDHLDCVGHFPHTQGDGTEVTGWVRSGAGFNSDRFDLMWARISDFIASRKQPSVSPALAGNAGHINP